MTTPTEPRTTLTARTPDDLVAMVPYVLGFRPEESMVMLTFGSGHPTFHARVDLPVDHEEVLDMVDALVDPVRRHGVAQVVLIAYGFDASLCREALQRLADALRDEGVAIVEMLRVCDGRWFPMLGEGAEAAHSGVRFDEKSHRFAAQAVLDGRVTLDSRQELADTLIGTDLDAIARLQDAVHREARQHPGCDEAAEAEWLQRVITCAVDGGVGLSTRDAGRVLVVCEELPLRDVVWSLMTRDNAEQYVELWRDLLRRTPADLQVVPASLLAFAAWLSGHGALAWCALDRANLADPDYTMARLVGTALEQALPPSIWEPFTDLPALLDGA